MRVWREMLMCSVLVCAACQGDDDGGSVDRGARLDSLDNADLRELCDVINERSRADATYTDFYCITQGVIGASRGEGACDALYDDCLEDPPPLCTVGDGETWVDPGACPATVQQYLDCTWESMELGKQGKQGLTCDTSLEELTSKTNEDVDRFEANPPPACAAIIDLCPGF